MPLNWRVAWREGRGLWNLPDPLGIPPLLTTCLTFEGPPNCDPFIRAQITPLTCRRRPGAPGVRGRGLWHGCWVGFIIKTTAVRSGNRALCILRADRPPFLGPGQLGRRMMTEMTSEPRAGTSSQPVAFHGMIAVRFCFFKRDLSPWTDLTPSETAAWCIASFLSPSA